MSTNTNNNLVKENTWCDCDQMPGLHNPCDCDNEQPVTDPMGWLRFQLEEFMKEIVTGKSEIEITVTVTPYQMSVSQNVTMEEALQQFKK